MYAYLIEAGLCLVNMYYSGKTSNSFQKIQFLGEYSWIFRVSIHFPIFLKIPIVSNTLPTLWWTFVTCVNQQKSMLGNLTVHYKIFSSLTDKVVM